MGVDRSDSFPRPGSREVLSIRAGHVGGTELGKQDVQQEDQEHGQRGRHREGGQERHPEQEPALQDEFAPLERRPEQRPAGEHTHADEAADSRQRRPGLIADVVDDAG